MKLTKYEKKIPKESIIKDKDFTETHYEDAISIDIPFNPDYTVDYITKSFFSSFPAWVLRLLKLRNIIVKPFGLGSSEVINFKEITHNKMYKEGDRAVFFEVIKRTDNELVMKEDDKHLNFRTSILILPSEKPDLTKLYSLTIVKFNNLLGKLYFIPVKHFHKLIIRTLLRNIEKKLTKTYQNENN